MARRSKPRVFIETSVFIRFLTRDDEKKFKQVVELFEKIETGEIRAVTSNIVWLEVIYVLTKLYKFPRRKVGNAVSELTNMRSMVTVEKTNTAAALSMWRTTNLPYGDCLIATQVPNNAQLATFDSDFRKISGLNIFNFD